MGALPGAKLPAPFCGSPAESPGGKIFTSMLFPPNALASGPQAGFGAEKEVKKVEVSKGGISLTSKGR
jgi:hypothetical protein